MGAFNGTGTFVRSYSWASDKANGIPITASRVDTEDTGFASGLTLCVTRDGQGQMAANFIAAIGSTYDLGSVSVPWRNLFLSGGITMGASAIPSASAVSALGTYAAAKLNPTSRNTAVTLTADPDLQVAIQAAGTYAIKMLLLLSGGAGGIQVTPAWSGTSTLATWGGYAYLGGVGGIQLMSSYGTSHGQTTLDASGDFFLIESVLGATSTGTLSLNWAQNSSNAANSTVGGGSYMTVSRLL